MRYVRIFPQDMEHDPMILKVQSPSGHVVWRQKVTDLACLKCKKLDERLALKRGIETDIEFRPVRDLCGSIEFFYIASSRIRHVLESFPDSDVDYFDFPSVPGYFVALPRRIIQASPGDPAFRIISNYRCPACGRYREICPGLELPVIAHGISVGAIQYEGAMGAKFVLVVSEDVAKALKEAKPKLTGIFFDPTKLSS